MKAIIFNSGLGNRMGDFTQHFHKSMTKLKNEETILHRQLRLLTEEGIQEFIITTGPFEEQIQSTAAEFNHVSFTFIRNEIYDRTNYIYSMYLAKNYIDDDMLFLHGDLVFNKKLVRDILDSHYKNCAPVNFTKPKPAKDFKGRVNDGKIIEISVHIFDDDCFAFQPFYKLQKAAASAWVGKVVQFISEGKISCYAENALNEIAPALDIRTFSYDGYYIDEIDNTEDRLRVMEEILNFDNE
ncbi:MAG: NTP transferase domain-containing protein [Desulfovibrionaceae bacterium]|nr:NTP transferase domain-containing protein [Desulfovibrionaceae bacterium]